MEKEKTNWEVVLEMVKKLNEKEKALNQMIIDNEKLPIALYMKLVEKKDNKKSSGKSRNNDKTC